MRANLKSLAGSRSSISFESKSMWILVDSQRKVKFEGSNDGGSKQARVFHASGSWYFEGHLGSPWIVDNVEVKNKKRIQIKSGSLIRLGGANVAVKFDLMDVGLAAGDVVPPAVVKLPTAESTVNLNKPDFLNKPDLNKPDLPLPNTEPNPNENLTASKTPAVQSDGESAITSLDSTRSSFSIWHIIVPCLLGVMVVGVVFFWPQGDSQTASRDSLDDKEAISNFVPNKEKLALQIAWIGGDRDGSIGTGCSGVVIDANRVAFPAWDLEKIDRNPGEHYRVFSSALKAYGEDYGAAKIVSLKFHPDYEKLTEEPQKYNFGIVTIDRNFSEFLTPVKSSHYNGDFQQQKLTVCGYQIMPDDESAITKFNLPQLTIKPAKIKTYHPSGIEIEGDIKGLHGAAVLDSKGNWCGSLLSLPGVDLFYFSDQILF